MLLCSLNHHNILQVPSSNCRHITGYYAAILYKTDILINKTYNSTDDREISVGGLYPYTDYTLQVITTNDENFTRETLEIFQTSQASECVAKLWFIMRLSIYLFFAELLIVSVV